MYVFQQKNEGKEIEKMEDAVASTILKELREFRAENYKRWEENDKRWEQNERCWAENDKRWTQNEERWQFTEKRLLNLEEAREKDRKELMDVLDAMQESISKQFAEMKEDIDTKIEKVFEVQQVHEKVLTTHEKRINFQNTRIKSLEDWKDEMENGTTFAI